MTETDGRCESSLVLLFPRLDVHFTVYTRSMASSVVAAAFHVIINNYDGLGACKISQEHWPDLKLVIETLLPGAIPNV